MIKESIISLLRKFRKNTAILILNIAGLTAGLTVFLLISMWITYELGYDEFEGNENVYRLSFGTSTYLTAGEGPFFAENCIEIKNIVRFKTFGSVQFEYKGKTCKANNMRLADSTVFDIFPYELIQGDKKEALVAPGRVVLSETISNTLFGNEDPVGKAIKVDGGFEVIVTGVMKDIDHTFNPVDALGSFVTLRLINEEPDILESLRTSQYQTYFLLENNVNIESLREKIHRLNIQLFEIEDQNIDNSVELVKLKDLYFHPVHGPRENHGNRTLVIIFLAVSFLTLLIACINFINLSIAKSSDSALEVGIRKVSGATRSRLFNIFLLESVIVVIFSGLLTLLLLVLLLPGFGNLVGVDFRIINYITLLNILAFIGLLLFIGCLAGIIPAGRLSAFSPLVYLRKMTREGKPSNIFRTILVVFQFTVSAILILSVLVVSKQMSYVKNYDLGFNQEDVLRVYFSGNIGEQKQLFRERLLDIPGVIDCSYSGAAIGGTNFEVFYYEDQRYLTQFLTVDPDFIKTMEIDILSGRSFSYERPADRLNTCILNESAIELIGLDIQDAPGKIINRRGWYLTTIPSEQLEIIGVVKDFNISSLRDSIPPYLICWGNWYNVFNIRINTANQNQILRSIETVWTEMNPDLPFEYRYMEEQIRDQYSNEERLTRILIYFSILAVVIACFGLLGLTAITVQSRTREIGIKKVHGAYRSNIVGEITVSFLKWIALALVIGTPVSVWLMGRWLSGFAYRTGIGIGIVLLGWTILMVISLLTVLYHTIKISDTNPAESVKYE